MMTFTFLTSLFTWWLRNVYRNSNESRSETYDIAHFTILFTQLSVILYHELVSCCGIDRSIVICIFYLWRWQNTSVNFMPLLSLHGLFFLYQHVTIANWCHLVKNSLGWINNVYIYIYTYLHTLVNYVRIK